MWERSALRTNFLGCEALVHKDLELGPFSYDFTLVRTKLLWRVPGKLAIHSLWLFSSPINVSEEVLGSGSKSMRHA